MLGYLMEVLMNAGARDVFYTPIYMKKNRPAYKVTVLCKEEMVEKMEALIFTHTTTIGIRHRQEDRTILPRTMVQVETPYGLLQMKQVEYQGEIRLYPEYESARLLAEQNNISIYEVYQSIPTY